MNEFTKDRPTSEQLVELLDSELDITICSDVVHGLDFEYKQLQQQNKMLKKQLEYLRSGEYYNQLRFERDVLQNIVFNGEISKEDKEFIDMTHRNTELLNENEQLKEDNILIKSANKLVSDKLKDYKLRCDKATNYYYKTLSEYEKENKQMPEESVMMFNLMEGNK